MNNIDIKQCLYHGITGYNIKEHIENKSIYILEKILKSGYLLSIDELQNEGYEFEKLNNIYMDNGFKKCN